MNLRNLLAVALIAIVFAGCQTTKSTQTPTIKPYIGSWSVSFTGSASGSGTLVIDNSSIFSNTVIIGGTTYNVTGNVNNNGDVENGILGGGSFTGHFGGNSGDGTWSVSGQSGTWSASKK